MTKNTITLLLQLTAALMADSTNENHALRLKEYIKSLKQSLSLQGNTLK